MADEQAFNDDALNEAGWALVKYGGPDPIHLNRCKAVAQEVLRAYFASVRRQSPDDPSLEEIALGLRGIADELEEDDSDAWRSNIVMLRECAEELATRTQSSATFGDKMREKGFAEPPSRVEREGYVAPAGALTSRDLDLLNTLRQAFSWMPKQSGDVEMDAGLQSLRGHIQRILSSETGAVSAIERKT